MDFGYSRSPKSCFLLHLVPNFAVSRAENCACSWKHLSNSVSPDLALHHNSCHFHCRRHSWNLGSEFNSSHSPHRLLVDLGVVCLANYPKYTHLSVNETTDRVTAAAIDELPYPYFTRSQNSHFRCGYFDTATFVVKSIANWEGTYCWLTGCRKRTTGWHVTCRCQLRPEDPFVTRIYSRYLWYWVADSSRQSVFSFFVWFALSAHPGLAPILKNLCLN